MILIVYNSHLQRNEEPMNIDYRRTETVSRIEEREGRLSLASETAEEREGHLSLASETAEEQEGRLSLALETAEEREARLSLAPDPAEEREAHLFTQTACLRQRQTLEIAKQ